MHLSCLLSFSIFILQITTFIRVKSLLGKLVICCLQFFPKNSIKLSKQILEGLLEYFFPPLSTPQYNLDDVQWFLKEINSQKCIFNDAFSSMNAQKNFLKFYLNRILSSANNLTADDNPLVNLNNHVSIIIQLIINSAILPKNEICIYYTLSR